MSRKDRFSIRNPRTFRKGAGINAMRVDNRFTELVEQKKREIKNFMQDLAGEIIGIYNIIENQRAVRFDVAIAGKSIKIVFIIWTDERNKDNNFITSQFAKFVFRKDEEFRGPLLKYLEGIQKGCLTEYLYGLALEELERERKIHSFNKTGRAADKYEKKDFVIRILQDGLIRDLYLQVKSSKEALMAVKEELLQRGVAGVWYCFTGDLKYDIENIKVKIIQVIEAYKQGQIIFV